VYPARAAGIGGGGVVRGRAARQCQAVSEAGLAAKLERVTERLAADAPGMGAPGHGLDRVLPVPGRHPARGRGRASMLIPSAGSAGGTWSRDREPGMPGSLVDRAKVRAASSPQPAARYSGETGHQLPRKNPGSHG